MEKTIKVGYGEPFYRVKIGSKIYLIGEEIEPIITRLVKDKGIFFTNLEYQKKSQTELLSEISEGKNVSVMTLKRYLKKLEKCGIVKSRLSMNHRGKIKILYMNEKAEVSSPLIDTRHIF